MNSKTHSKSSAIIDSATKTPRSAGGRITAIAMLICGAALVACSASAPAPKGDDDPQMLRLTYAASAERGISDVPTAIDHIDGLEYSRRMASRQPASPETTGNTALLGGDRPACTCSPPVPSDPICVCYGGLWCCLDCCAK